MDNNIMGLIISVIFFCSLYVISSILFHTKVLVGEKCRKFIHIITGFWWIIAMEYFDHYLYAAIIPVIFIVLNTISYKFKLVKMIERKNEKHLGTIFYPISLLVLVILSFGIFDKPYIGAIGILLMAYGDGLAAIVGSEVRSRHILKNKTLIGSLTMFFVSVVFTTLILLKYNRDRLIISVLMVSIVATLSELFSNKGLDNLSVPILSTLTYIIIMSI